MSAVRVCRDIPRLLLVAQLTTYSTGNKVNSMRVREEALGIRNNLLDVEAFGLVFARGHVGNIDEERALQAAIRSAALIRASWVWESLIISISNYRSLLCWAGDIQFSADQTTPP